MRANISVEESLWKNFKKLAIDLNETISGRLSKLIKKDLEENSTK